MHKNISTFPGLAETLVSPATPFYKLSKENFPVAESFQEKPEFFNFL